VRQAKFPGPEHSFAPEESAAPSLTFASKPAKS